MDLLDDLRSLTGALVDEPHDDHALGELTETQVVDLLRSLEDLKAAACATQADLAVRLDHTVRAREAAAGVAAARRGRGVANQVALARRESPHRGRVLLGFAQDLATDLPHTRAALAAGRLNEHRAMIIARETGCLDSHQRSQVDHDTSAPADVGEDDPLDGLGTARLAGQVRARVAATDPAAVVRRQRRAESERHVSVRPAPDGMAYLSGLLSLTQAVACYAALDRDAKAIVAAGDPAHPGRPRSKGQVMADLLVERVTGQASADAVPVTVSLVMSDATLLGAGHEPATIPGHGTVPAQVARETVARATEQLQAWVRRLYTDPAGRLIALSTTQRLATEGLADFLKVRDQGLCRTPWCDAPARHVDHITPWAEGGATDAENLQGLCEACNHAKQATGWRQQALDSLNEVAGRHLVETTTPTGHRHRSPAPTPPQPARSADPAPRRASRPRVDLVFNDLVDFVHAA